MRPLPAIVAALALMALLCWWIGVPLVWGEVYFATGFETCYVTPGAGEHAHKYGYFTGAAASAWTGQVVGVGVAPDSEPEGQNKCVWGGLAAQAGGSGTYRCLRGNLTAEKTDLKVTAKVRLKGDVSGLNVNRMILGFRNYATGNLGCFVSAKRNGNPPATALSWTLFAHYRDRVAKTCTGSTKNGKTCTVDADCPLPESECVVEQFATMDVQDDTWVLVTLAQTSVNGQVRCEIWGGAAGQTPQAFPRGGMTRTVGQCSAGKCYSDGTTTCTTAAECGVDPRGCSLNEPCQVTGDCLAGTCTINSTLLVTPDDLCIGDYLNATPGGAIDMRFDDLMLYDGTEMPNIYVEPLRPQAPGVIGNWSAASVNAPCETTTSGIPECIDDGWDGRTSDGTTTAVKHNQTSDTRLNMPLSDPLATATPGPHPTASPVAFVYELVGQDSSSLTGARLKVSMTQTTTQSPVKTCLAGTDAEKRCFADSECPSSTCVDGYNPDLVPTSGTSAPYWMFPAYTRGLTIFGGAWGVSDLTQMRLDLDRTAEAKEVRLTSAAASIVWRVPNPIPPDVLPDVQSDGFTTLAWAGDSTWNRSAFQGGMGSGMFEPTHLYFYTRGGTKIGDSEDEWSTIVAGTATSFLTATPLRGLFGKPPDVIFVQHWTNTLGNRIFHTNLNAAIGGVGQSGYCEMPNGGAGQGAPCNCPDQRTSDWRHTDGGLRTPAPGVTPSTKWCLTNANFGTPCGSKTPGLCETCTTDAQCKKRAESTGSCLAGQCQPYLGAPWLPAPGATPSRSMKAATTGIACTGGCKDAPDCVGGICVQSIGIGAIAAALTRMEQRAAAVQFPPHVVWVSAPPGTGLGFGWYTAREAMATLGRHLRTRALATGKNFVDLYQRFHRDCDDLHEHPDGTVSTIIRAGRARQCMDAEDGVHWTDYGQREVAVGAFTECVTGAVGNEAPGTRHTDGYCDANGTCILGMKGDKCATHLDCATWRCNWGNPTPTPTTTPTPTP